MNTKLTLLLGLGLIFFALGRRRREGESSGLLKSPAAEPHGDLREEQGRLMVRTPWGYIALEPGESEGDPGVLERARKEAEAREVSRFYEAIAREREKRIPPGSRLKRDRWGFLYEKNPKGLGWREFGSDPDEPYELKANGSW
jgi:hypothetical protein